MISKIAIILVVTIALGLSGHWIIALVVGFILADMLL